jgi:hypothetical protein
MRLCGWLPADFDRIDLAATSTRGELAAMDDRHLNLDISSNTAPNTTMPACTTFLTPDLIGSHV